MSVSNYLRLKEMYNGNPDLMLAQSKREVWERHLEQQAQKELESEVADSVARAIEKALDNVFKDFK